MVLENSCRVRYCARLRSRHSSLSSTPLSRTTRSARQLIRPRERSLHRATAPSTPSRSPPSSVPWDEMVRSWDTSRGRTWSRQKKNQPMSSKVGGVAPVYASDLKTLVGHFYPGVGFVALGTSPASKPCIPEQTVLSRAANGQTVVSTIACPSTIETVPTIVGTFLPTAMGQLSSESLQANISYVHSPSVSEGYVMSVTPGPGSKVPARSVLTVVSSLGPVTNGVPVPPPTMAQPTRITVPNTTGLTQAEACASLQQADLSCRAQTVSSSSVVIGHVLSQGPAPGEYAAPQQTVVITVSSGP